MDISVKKPPIHLLWLDTWVLLELTKARHDQNMPSHKRSEALSIIDQIKALTLQGKLICPEAEQGIEIEYGTRLLPEARCLQAELSRGVRTRYHRTIEELQTQRVMIAQVSHRLDPILPYHDLFLDDPLSRLTSRDPFTVSVHFNWPRDMLDQFKQTDSTSADNWERLRIRSRTQKMPFATRLSQERLGFISAQRECLLKLAHGQNLDFNDAVVLGRYLTLWRAANNGDPESVFTILNFMLSDDFWMTPFLDISTRLIARLTIDQEPIKSSDVTDVNHVAAMLPYAHSMVMDRRMRHKVSQQLKLDKKYQTNILRLKELPQLLANLSSGP